jgi:hypothetical protein
MELAGFLKQSPKEIFLISSVSQNLISIPLLLVASGVVKRNAMPADRGRASQACTACRRQKTRCYVRPGSACLRCERLHQHCSLDDVDNNNDTPINDYSGSTDARLVSIDM